MRSLIETAFDSVSNKSISFIDIFKDLNAVFNTRNIDLERTDNSGQWKYGDVGIKQSYFANDMMIHIEVDDEFVDINENQINYLVQIMSQIYVHEKKHMDQYMKNPNMNLESGSYLELSYEIEAHAVDAVEGFIQIGYDPVDIFKNNLWDEYASEIESAWIYWDTYGRYDDNNDDPIWQAFLKAFEEEISVKVEV